VLKSRSRKFWKGGSRRIWKVGYGNSGKVRVAVVVAVAYFTSDSATLVTGGNFEKSKKLIAILRGKKV